MYLEDFNYSLPKNLIAKRPTDRRESKILICSKKKTHGRPVAAGTGHSTHRPGSYIPLLGLPGLGRYKASR